MGLTQAELAARAKVQQSVISVYEAGVRDPTVSTLERLIDAAGMRLTWSLAHGGSGGGHLATLSGPAGRRVVERREVLLDVLTRWALTGARIIGSVATGTETHGEPVLIVVDDRPGGAGHSAAMALIGAAGEIGVAVGRPVTVIPESEIERHDLTPADLAAAVPLDR